MASRIRFALGQLGSKPGAGQALDRLLDAPDLESFAARGTSEPQRWSRLDQRTWRTGAVADPRPWQTAARAAGSVTAWRSLQAGPAPRWLWLQWSPMASPAGAVEALAAAGETASGVRNLRARVRSGERRDVQPPPAVAGADQVCATDEETTGPDPVLTLRCVTGRHLVLLCASGQGWHWPALVALAELQLRRLPRAETDPPR